MSHKIERGMYKKTKGENKIVVTLFKVVSIILLIILQIVILGALYAAAHGIYQYVRIIYHVIRVVMLIHLLNRHDSAAYKVSWILFILFMPVIGMLVYFLWGNSKLRSKKEKEYRRIRVDSEKLLQDSSEINQEIKAIDRYKYNQVEYTNKITGYPTYHNQGIKYFEIGEKFFDSYFEDLKKAKHYILIEFYILAQGKLWDLTYEILKQKVKEGVKVQIIFDSLGGLLRKPKNFVEEMEKDGIEVYVFNPLSPIVSGYINYRDHRKIVVVDGTIAYTGGVNLADEYANIIERFGYWKDVGIKVEGKAAWSYAMMFLRALEQITEKPIDYHSYEKISYDQNYDKKNLNGYVLPFGDGPDNRKNPTESIYIQTINYAKNYIYITTPYFVVSESLLTALLNSARAGVDVRVIVPHIPDKKFVNMVTKSYYEVLLESGIRVYEYKPGFIHSKTFVADDDTSLVGTANLDFRSMHLNFECVNYSYQTGEELAVKNDFQNMLKECIEIDADEWKKRPFWIKMLEALMSAFAPML